LKHSSKGFPIHANAHKIKILVLLRSEEVGTNTQPNRKFDSYWAGPNTKRENRFKIIGDSTVEDIPLMITLTHSQFLR